MILFIFFIFSFFLIEKSVAETLGQSECPVLHIKGTNHLFSCYEVGEHVRFYFFFHIPRYLFLYFLLLQLLAFYSEMPVDSIASFDTAEADEKMASFVAELRILLVNLIPGPY